MVDEPILEPKQGFQWLTTYAVLIADAANRWAYLEYYIQQAIWELAEVSPAIGACLTSQMYTFNSKMSALLALLKLRKAPQPLIDRVNKFASQVRDAHDARNRAAHDIWLNDNVNPEQMGKLRITADKILRYNIEEIKGDELLSDVKTIELRRAEAGFILQAVRDTLPSLPQISPEELHPIVESQPIP